MRRWTLPQARLGWFGLLALVVGCGRHGVGAPEGGSAVSPARVILSRNVDLTQVDQRPLVYRVETVGMLEAEGQTDIAAGVSGVVDEVLFREGDYVQPGTLLAKVDQVRYESEDELARANLERARAHLDLTKDLTSRTLRATLGTSEEEKVKARGNLQTAEAEYRASVASLARARANLDRSRVRAPYAGRINKRHVTKGSYLEERTPIATMADLSHIRLVGYVPETAAPLLRDLLQFQEERLNAVRLGLLMAGMSPAAPPGALQMAGKLVHADYVLSGYDPEFELHALTGQTYFGRIFHMSTVANPDTHMFEVKAEVLGWAPPLVASAGVAPQEPVSGPPVKEDIKQPGPSVSPFVKGGNQASETPLKLKFSHVAPQRLWPGFTARIRFPMKSNPGASVIPEESVRANERGFIAFVPAKLTRDDGSVEWVARVRVLELGFRAAGWVEVRSGLAFGEWVVQRGAEALEDGTPIRFKVGPK